MLVYYNTHQTITIYTNVLLYVNIIAVRNKSKAAQKLLLILKTGKGDSVLFFAIEFIFDSGER